MGSYFYQTNKYTTGESRCMPCHEGAPNMAVRDKHERNRISLTRSMKVIAVDGRGHSLVINLRLSGTHFTLPLAPHTSTSTYIRPSFISVPNHAPCPPSLALYPSSHSFHTYSSTSLYIILVPVLTRLTHSPTYCLYTCPNS